MCLQCKTKSSFDAAMVYNQEGCPLLRGEHNKLRHPPATVSSMSTAVIWVQGAEQAFSGASSDCQSFRAR